MRIILLKCVLLFSLVPGVLQAEKPTSPAAAFFPPMTMLAQEEYAGLDKQNEQYFAGLGNSCHLIYHQIGPM